MRRREIASSSKTTFPIQYLLEREDTLLHISYTNNSIIFFQTSQSKDIFMKHTFITIILIGGLLLFSGCQESQKEHDAKVAQQAREELLKEMKAKEEAQKKKEAELEKQSKLSQMGFKKTPDGKIIIDMNKTKSYFQNLAQQMQTKVEQIHKELESGNINEEEAGIEVNQTHINIDLNKTKNFLDIMGKKMQGYVKEFESVVQELNDTTVESK